MKNGNKKRFLPGSLRIYKIGLTALIASLFALAFPKYANADEIESPIVRIFEFAISPENIEVFMQAGQKNVQASIRDEPGVLSMYCMADKLDPTKIYVVEVYENEAAYIAHTKSLHFREFIAAIEGKLTSRRIIETHPRILGAKPFDWSDQFYSVGPKNGK